MESEMHSDNKRINIRNQRDLVTQMKKAEVDVAIVKNINEKLVCQLVKIQRQCWANAEYSRRECLEVLGIATSVPNDLLEATVSKVFDKRGVHIKGKIIQVCHPIKDNERAIAKLSNGKDSLQIFCVKKHLNSLNLTELDFPESTRIFVNESLFAADFKNMFSDINIFQKYF